MSDFYLALKNIILEFKKDMNIGNVGELQRS